MITPITENRFSVLPHSSSPSITPMMPSGSDIMMASGWLKLRNCATRIM